MTSESAPGTTGGQRVLVLVRHAKAEHVFGKLDHDRDLTNRGHRDAVAAGKWLAGRGLAVDQALVSTSNRTEQTNEDIWTAGLPIADVRMDPRIYNASAATLLDLVRAADPDAGVVMVVGHAPGIPWLASLLDDGEGNGRAVDDMAGTYPTTGIAVLSHDGEWTDLGPGGARLEDFHVARG